MARTVGRVLQDLGLLGLVERVTNYLAHPLARPIVTMWIRGEAPSAEELREIVADSAIDLATGKLLPGRPGVGGPKRKALAPDAPDATPHRPAEVPKPPPTVPAKSPPRLGEPHPGAVPESVTVEAPRHPAAAPDATRQIPGSSPGGTTGGKRPGGSAPPGGIPQGLSESQFRDFSRTVRDGAGHLGDDISVHGSRASGTASAGSDNDVAIRTSPERFNEPGFPARG